MSGHFKVVAKVGKVSLQAELPSGIEQSSPYFPCVYLRNSRMDGRTCNIKHKCVKSQTPRQAKRGRDTKIPQSGGPPEKVGDEAAYKELGDIMERAATTTSSLEAEQDSGNINRT
ncbi:hypothetical protein Tco_0872011 [Tanacetum coccineum]